MPPSLSERRRLEQELTELPVQLAGYWRELAATPAEDKTRWEWLEWQIRRGQQRRAVIEARRAALRADGAEAR